jgi:hypothetical protein
MAIRKFSLLKTSEIAEAPFRSLQEVEDYLNQQVKKTLDELDSLLRQYQLQFSRIETKSALEFRINRTGDPKKSGGGGKFSIDKIDKIVVPNLKALRQQFDVVDNISDQVESLEALFNNVSVQFRGTRGLDATLKNIKSMHRAAQAKMDKALTFLGKVGSKYEPTPFRELVNATMQLVAPNLDFKDGSSLLYAHENREGFMTFTHYVKLRGLRDSEDGVYPQFFLVFTCILKHSDQKTKVMPHYYVTVMHEFSAPGKFGLGRQVDSPQKAATALSLMLELENVGNAIGTLPHNLDPNKVTPSKFSVGSKVAKITVDTSSFAFELLASIKEDEAKKIATTIYTELKGMLAHIKRAQLKAKVVKEGGRYTIRYTLTNLAPSDKVSTQDVDWLKEHFGLEDDKLRRVVQIINHD